MIDLLKRRRPSARVRVTPDPETAERLARKRAELSYRPEGGFHYERVQQRIPSLLRRQAG